MSSEKQIAPGRTSEVPPENTSGSPEEKETSQHQEPSGEINHSEQKEEKADPPPHLLCDGVIFDKYRIVSFIGSGGMSEVYKAEHLLLKQIFALKVLKELSSKSESAGSKRFLREAKCFHQLVHPNIVRVFEIGCDRNSAMLYISMEYLSGGSLADSAGRKFSETEILKVASDIACALEELERHNMVHRDIKPSNIMRDNDGNCKLMDLGIAKIRWESCDALTLTLDHCVIGTPAYASPEQCRTPHNVDIRSDIYSLGVTLYQLASGVVPYVGTTPLETLLNVIHRDPPPLEKLPTELSSGSVALIKCMMEKSPEKRPANAAALKEMIENVKAGGTLKAPGKHSGIKRFLVAACLFAAAAGAGIGGTICFSECLAPERESSTAAFQVQVLPAGKILQQEEKTFSQINFLTAGKERTIPVRIAEFRRIIQYLKSSEAKGISFRTERLKLFTEWLKKLELLARRKKDRKTRRFAGAMPPDLKNELEKELKTRKFPFSRDHKGIYLTRKIITALQESSLDPDSTFVDGNNHLRSLTGFAVSGLLPLQEELLKKLIFAGANIDAGHGPVLKAPLNMVVQRIKARLTGIMAFNGSDNVDLREGRSMLLSVLDPERTYLVCRPSGNYLDWPLADFLVESGARLDVENKQGRTPVHLAALHNRADLLEKILLAGSMGGDVRDQEGDTPYQLAVRNHASEAVKVLTRFGLTAPLTSKDRAQGALIYGIINNEPLQAEQALDAGASLQYLYANKLNALQNAVVYRRKDLVKFLLSRGASPGENAEKISLPGIAVCIASPEIFLLLLEKLMPENMTIQQGNHRIWLPETVLAHFRRRADLAAGYFDAMLKCKWNINQEGPGKMNVLERALCYRQIDPGVIRVLLARGADPAAVLARKKVPFRKIDPRLYRLIKESAKGSVQNK